MLISSLEVTKAMAEDFPQNWTKEELEALIEKVESEGYEEPYNTKRRAEDPLRWIAIDAYRAAKKELQRRKGA
jgi:hypothetical protein